MPINIHGKNYKTVAERVNEIHRDYKDKISIVTEFESIDIQTGLVIIKATVTKYIDELELVYTGYACEQKTTKGINSTSVVENCETSAIGRALAAAGYAGSEYCSANELETAIYYQRNKVKNSPVIVK